MMNALAIGLVLTTLLTAVVWSPSATHHDDHREVIVKEGHRVVVVEYDKEADGSTKVLISPNDVVVPSAVDSKDEDKPAERSFSGPRELVCDAYGKCKHKIAAALGKTKDKVDETVHGVSDKAREIEERTKDAVNEAMGTSSSQDDDKVTGHTISEPLLKAKDSVAHGIDKVKKVAGDVAGTVKDGAVKVKNFDVVDSPKRIEEDIERNVTGKVEESMKQTVENVIEVGEKSLGDILKKLKDVTYDVIWYMMGRDKAGALVGLVHMLGFSTAYGMSVWVTFISSYILGRHLPKQQFGLVQSRIYPVYFKAMAYCVSAALLGHLASQKNGILTGMFGLPGLCLVSALLMVLTNMVLLEPRATKAMHERMKIEKEEGRGVVSPARDGLTDHGGGGANAVKQQANVVAERQDVLRLNEKLKRLNAYSSALNVSALVALTWHMAHMSNRLAR
ncbi:hypothetical protein R6Q59_034462 [Mikania micrantha]|uniref:TMEM205-like domain-containing protein n=1 Tax=Mikania micrantha TaxID=192012 RepID=A0A5N6NK25_9ASTR|nr:hypothetical protein E3N88_20608 [Mikania micrantha]